MIKANRGKALRVLAVLAVALLFAACGQKDDATYETADAAKVPVTTTSDEARSLYMQGRALLDDLHFVEAHEIFVAAVEEDPDFAMGHFMVATTSLSAAEFFDAVGKANASASGASEGEQLFIRALVAASENDQASQLDAINELLAMYPDDERAHMARGNYANGQQDFAGAVEHFTHATQINPEFASAHNALGYALRSLDDLDGARASFARYVELIPDEANPYDSYAELLMEMGNYDESIENYRKALNIDSNFSASYAGVSINESLKGNADLALEASDQMLAHARNFAERQGALFQSVTSHLYAGDTDAAMDVCTTMLAEAEVKGDRSAMGNIYEYMGDTMLSIDDAAKAEEYFAAALEQRQMANTNDANKAQAKRTHQFKMAIAAMVAEDLETATTRAAEYTVAAEANGTSFEKRRVHELAGYLAMMNGDMQAGVEHLAQGSQVNPHVLYWSAVAHSELGNTEKAAKQAARAANRNTLSPNLPFVRANAVELLASLDAG